MIESSILIKNEGKDTSSNRIKKFIILEFTKELIRNYSPEEILKLKDVLEEENKLKSKYQKTKNKVKEIMQSKERETESITEGMLPSILEGKNLFFSGPPRKEPKGFSKYGTIRDLMPQVGAFEKGRISTTDPFKELKLIIPETRFPPHLQYIKPIPVNKEIDLGKLNPLLKDSFVKAIECYGADYNILVKGNMGIKKTGIILNKEEIEKIVEKFSEETKIPAQEGIFKVVVGRLIFLAIVSEIIGSKFIIRKMQSEEMGAYPV
ncbi:MAG: hypothetical protein ABIE36_03320 [Candidatus Diapherotrites archaeon]